jgi:hypothetical protein
MSLTYVEADCPGWCQGRHTSDEAEAGPIRHLATVAEDFDIGVVIVRGGRELPVSIVLASADDGQVQMTSAQARVFSAWLLRAADTADFGT